MAESGWLIARIPGRLNDQFVAIFGVALFHGDASGLIVTNDIRGEKFIQ